MSEQLIVPTMAELIAEGKTPDILFWVGSAGSYDDSSWIPIRERRLILR